MADGSHLPLGGFDLHAHTTMSDGDLSLEEVAALASDLGITIGVSDHVSSRNSRRFVSGPDKLDSYLAALAQAPVLRSAELCWQDPFSHSVADRLSQALDYLIGSNHGFELDGGIRVTPWTETLPAELVGHEETIMDAVVENLCRLVHTLPIDIAAHSTLLPAALTALDPDPERWWTEPREDRFIDAIVESGTAVEISNRYRLPHDRFLRKARQAGALFTLGSDGHHRHQVGQLGWALETAHRTGMDERVIFLPERQSGS